MKGKIIAFTRILVSMGLVALLLWLMRGNFGQIRGTLAKTSLLNMIAVSLRLKLLFIGEGLDISFGRVVELSFIGTFFNNFMPTAVGGDIVKVYYVFRHTKEMAKSFIAVFMDRFVGVFSFLLISMFVLMSPLVNIDIALKKLVFYFTFLGIAAFVIILNSAVEKVILRVLSKISLWNIGDHLSRVYRAVNEYRNKKGLILAVIGVSAISQCIYFYSVYLLGKSLGSGVLLKTVFLLMPIVSIVSMLPSLGGLGLREGALVALFGPIIGPDNALSISILLLATLLIMSIAGGLIYISAAQFKIKQADIKKIETYGI
jgi:glycosyltransferase 2 family protein